MAIGAVHLIAIRPPKVDRPEPNIHLHCCVENMKYSITLRNEKQINMRVNYEYYLFWAKMWRALTSLSILVASSTHLADVVRSVYVVLVWRQVVCVIWPQSGNCSTIT